MLYANTTSLPALLQSLFGYDATTSGLVLSPAGFASVIALVIVGKLMARGVDARVLIAAGLVVLAAGNFWMSLLNLDVSPWGFVWPRIVLITGLSMLFAPLNVAAFQRIPKEIRGAAVGLLALLRNEGGSVGTSVAQTIQERREQFHVLRLNEQLDPLNPAVQQFFSSARAFFFLNTGDQPTSQKMAIGVLDKLRQQQASSLAYFDVFWASAVVAGVLIAITLTMRRSVAPKGVHVSAE